MTAKNFEKKRKRKHDMDVDDYHQNEMPFLQRVNPQGTFPKKSKKAEHRYHNASVAITVSRLSSRSRFSSAASDLSPRTSESVGHSRRPSDSLTPDHYYRPHPDDDIVKKLPFGKLELGPQCLKDSPLVKSTEKSVNPDKNSFPTDLVGYLRQIAAGIPKNGTLDHLIVEKCLEECDGEETNLLGYQESSRLVEKIFGGSRFGAFEFLKKLNRVKRKKRADLLFNGCSAHTVESLLLALIPLDFVHNEVISEWMETIIDFWKDLIVDRSASHVIRSFAAMLFGITLSKGRDEYKKVKPQPRYSNPEMTEPLRQEFLKIANLAMDFNSMKDYMQFVPISLLMQDVIDLDAYAKSGKVTEFVMKALDDTAFIETSLQGRESSRIWEKIILAIDDDLRETLYNAISRNIKKLALNVYGNYPIQKLISLAKSEEMVTEICEEFLPLVPKFIDEHKHLLVAALIKITAHNEELQTSLISTLKKYFHCKKASSYFVPQVLCMNEIDLASADVSDSSVHFDVEKSTIAGSVILRELMRLSCHKTVVKSLFAIDPEDLRQMAMHKVASHVLDYFFESPVIDTDSKMKLSHHFDWVVLISDKFGSRVFDSFWDNVELSMLEREIIMEQLVDSYHEKTTSIFRLMYNKLKVKEYREDKAKWKRAFETERKQKLNKPSKEKSSPRKEKNKDRKSKRAKEEITMED